MDKFGSNLFFGANWQITIKGVLFVEMDLTLEYHKINHMPIAIMYYNTKLEIYDRYKVRSYETRNWSKQFILFDECGSP